MMVRTKTLAVSSVVAGLALALGLFTNMSATPPFAYTSLTNLNSGLCVTRPSTAAVPFYQVMTKGDLTDAQILYHAANRLGFGISPRSPLVPMKSNDCTTVFLAEEIARQIAVIGTDQDGPEVSYVRSNLLQLTLFKRNDVNALLSADKLGPKISNQGNINWKAAHETVLLTTLRDVVGSQYVDASGAVYDHQVNLEDLFTEFWLNHFNTDKGKMKRFYFGSDGYIFTIRRNIGGSFLDLLKASIKHPAMNYYLDNADNRYVCITSGCAASNQNLARELMELHTFGVGPRTNDTDPSPYSQLDVEKMAQVLAGWNLRDPFSLLPSGETELVYNSLMAANVDVTLFNIDSQLIKGTKYVAGSQRLDEVLKDLANHPQTKNAVCKKLATNLYAPSIIQSAQNACVTSWGSDGDLKAMYRALILLPDFWMAKNYMKLNKSSIELVVASMRALGMNGADLKISLKSAIDKGDFNPNLFAFSQISVNGGDTYISNYDNVLKNSGTFKLINYTQAAMDRMGFIRGQFNEPTGYPEDRREFLSSYFVDNASRMVLELTNKLWWLDSGVGDWRQDIVCKSSADALNSRGITAASTQQYWYRNMGKLGDVVRFTSSTPGPVPYTLPSAQQTIVQNILSTTSSYATYTSGTTSYILPERTYAAVALANATQLKK